ncbi:Nucleotidyltransferase, partial [Gymnopus androsaceus JB14]
MTSPSSKRSASESISPPPSKRKRSCSPDSFFSDVSESPLYVFLVDAKLNGETIEELISLVDQFNLNDTAKSQTGVELQLSLNAEDADIIVTEVRMRARLERHLDWVTAKQKAIVTTQWLRDSVRSQQLLPCGKYAALGELYEETVHNCPENNCAVDAPSKAKKENTNIRYNHRYACMRNSPLNCPNQVLIKKLAVLRRHRELEGLDVQALSYERAISVLKAFPHHITANDVQQVSDLPHIGPKILSKIEEFIQRGDITECNDILSEARYQSLVAFTEIYGIGPSTARNLYSLGLRTIEDLEKHYKDKDNAKIQATRIQAPAKKTFTSPTSKLRELGLPEMTVKEALLLREDLNVRIPRSEVEEIRDVIMNELGQIRRGCVSMITGGYRRGKIESNDIDIVISHKDLKSGGDEVKGLCATLVKRLYDKGIVTHVMHLSSFRPHNTLRTAHWDSLEKALTVVKLRDNNNNGTGQKQNQKHIHRRLDLIFAAPEVYWTAVVGWTGSIMFERDLRFWAKQEKGMRFDSSGISRRHDSKLYFPKSEEEVFELLGLEWIDPTLRNADM